VSLVIYARGFAILDESLFFDHLFEVVKIGVLTEIFRIIVPFSATVKVTPVSL